MKTAFPKLAAALLTISSVAFMGLSIAGYYGRPDPVAEMSAPELDNYQFTATPGETVSWSVRQIFGSEDGTREPEKQHDNAYAAIADAYKMEVRRLNADSAAMTDLATSLRDRLTLIRAHQQADEQAILDAIGLLDNQLASLKAQHDRLSKDLQALMVETTAIRSETARRRQDVTRLQNELDELRTDTFRLEQIQRVLTDRLVQLQLENQALDQRIEQFQDMGVLQGSDAPEAVGADTDQG